MPRKDIDYSKTVIYKITCNDETVDYTYVGHTTDFGNRKYQHKMLCTNEKSSSYHIKLYKTIREYGGWSNWSMSEIACYNCKNATEARIKEQEHYELVKANLNSVPPYVEPKKKVTCNNDKELINDNESNKHKNKITNNAVTYQINNLDSNLDSMDSYKSQQDKNKYICFLCNYNTFNKKDYNKHLNTLKHLKSEEDSKNNFQNIIDNKIWECECGKNYKYDSGYYKHKKKCKFNQIKNSQNNEIQNETQNELNILTNKDDLIIKLIKDNEEFKQLLKEQNLIISQQQQQNFELVQTIKEITPKIGNNNNNTTITNNSNNTTNNNFNLQLFLNEKCKDAINMSDFIKTIKFTESDLENSRIHGGVSTLSNVMIKSLKQLDVTKRPVHCTDVKRETLYIKEQEKWEKDENHEKIMEAFGNIAEKQRDYIWEWSDANPDTQNVYHPLNDVFHHTNVKVLDPIYKKEQEGKKFIRNISKEILIEKK